MAVKIKLKRLGKTHAPQYRIVVADSRTARNGRAIEEIGIYQPLQNPSIIQVKSERVLYWLGVGALPTPAVEAILKVTGDWQKFKGLPGTEGTLKFATPKPAKSIAYEAAVKQAMDEPKEGATTMKKKAQEKLAAKANPAPVEEVVVSEPTVSDVVVEETPVVEAVAEVAAEAVVETPAEEAAAE